MLHGEDGELVMHNEKKAVLLNSYFASDDCEKKVAQPDNSCTNVGGASWLRVDERTSGYFK